jgi:hypothetical protein
LLKKFESKEAGDTTFLDNIHSLIGKILAPLYHIFIYKIAEDEAHATYNELFSDTSLEVGKTLSKEERDSKDLNAEKVSPLTTNIQQIELTTHTVSDLWGGRVPLFLSHIEKGESCTWRHLLRPGQRHGQGCVRCPFRV